MKTTDPTVQALQAENAQLRQHVADLNQLLDQLPGVAYRCDNDFAWTMHYMSAGCFELTGYQPADLLYNARRSYASLIYPDDRLRVAEEVQTALDVQQPFQLSYRIQRADGTLRHVMANGRGIFDDENRVLFLEGFLVDMTRQYEAEQARQRQAATTAILTVAEDFLGSAHVMNELPALLARLGAAANVSRAYIFQNHTAPDGTLRTSQRYEWVAAGVKPEIGNPDLQHLPYKTSGLERWQQQLQQRQVIYGLIRDFPAEEQAILKPQHIQSLAVVPIFLGNHWWGFVGFDHCWNEHEWAFDEIGALRTAAGLISDVIQREQAEREIRESQFLLTQILNSLPAPFSVRDGSGRYLQVNHAYCEAVGKPAEDIVNHVIEDVFPPRSAEIVRGHLEHVWATHEVLNDEEHLRVADGMRYYHALKFPVYDLDGTIIAVGGLSTDITRMKQVEQQLRENQRLLQAIMDNSTAITFARDRAGRFLLVNRHYSTLLQLPAEAVVGKTLADVYPPASAERLRQNDQQVFAAGTSVQFEELIEFPDGMHHLYAVKFPLFADDGTMYGLGGISTDVTQLKQVEQQLRENQKLIQAVLDYSAAIIFVRDTNGRFLLASRHLADLVHTTPEEMTGKTIDDVYEPATAAMLRGHDQEVIQSGRAIEREESVQRQGDPQTYEYLAIKFPLFDEQGRVYAVGGISSDITRRKQVERDLQIFRALVARAPDAIVMTDVDGIISYVNAAAYTMYGYSEQDTMIGLNMWHMLSDASRAHDMTRIVQEIDDQGFWVGEAVDQRRDGSTFPSMSSIFVIQADDAPSAIGIIVRDLTDQKAIEEERVALQAQIIQAQQAAIRQLSTPLIPIAEGVVVLPLIGQLDEQRAQAIMETLLEGVASYQADIVLLDMTGVPMADAQIADSLIRLTKAVQLLGSHVILTGMQSQLALLLVQLGLNLDELETRSTLQAGIASVLGRGRR